MSAVSALLDHTASSVTLIAPTAILQLRPPARAGRPCGRRLPFSWIWSCGRSWKIGWMEPGHLRLPRRWGRSRPRQWCNGPCVSCPGAALERRQLYRQMVSERFLPNWDKVVLGRGLDVGSESMDWEVGPNCGRDVAKEGDGAAIESGKCDRAWRHQGAEQHIAGKGR